MSTFWIRSALFASFCFTMGCSGTASAPQDHSALFEGDWNVSEYVDNEKASPPSSTKQMTVNFLKGEFKVIELTGTKILQTGNSTFTLNPTKSPSEADFVSTLAPDLGKTRLAIYSLEGNTLKLCIADLKEPRPSQLAAGPKRLWMVLTKKTQ